MSVVECHAYGCIHNSKGYCELKPDRIILDSVGCCLTKNQIGVRK